MPKFAISAATIQAMETTTSIAARTKIQKSETTKERLNQKVEVIRRAADECSHVCRFLGTVLVEEHLWIVMKLYPGSLLDELHEVGLTVAMAPEMEPLTGRVTHDVYHVYTADVHLVRAVDRLRRCS